MSLFYTKSPSNAADPEGIEGKEQGKNGTEGLTGKTGSVGGGRRAECTGIMGSG